MKKRRDNAIKKLQKGSTVCLPNLSNLEEELKS